MDEILRCRVVTAQKEVVLYGIYFRYIRARVELRIIIRINP